MARPASDQPTQGELEILQVLWKEGESSLGVIRESLQAQRPVATTTVATMLKVMLEKGLVSRSRGDRGYVWSATTARQETEAGLLRRLVERVFEGSARGAVVRLLEDGQLDRADRDAIRELLDRHESDEGGR